MSTVELVRTNGGTRVYRIPMTLFPGLAGFAHLICSTDARVLLDVGSGFGDSDDELQAGLQAVRTEYPEPVDWSCLTAVIISHGHIDHFGGLPSVRRHTAAPVGVHELDLPVLVNYEERLAVVARRLRAFLVEAGVEGHRQQELMELYLLNKGLFASQPVDFTFEAAGMRVGPLELLHVPGHCPGQIVARVDDIVLTSDHVLPKTSPHQAPEVLSHYTGLGHYLESLERVATWGVSARQALGGHEPPFADLPARVEAIRRLHAERLEQVMGLMDAPKSVAEIAEGLFPSVGGYDVLLALEEAGAHVEYLAQRGLLGIANLHDLESERPTPIQYRRLDGPTTARLLLPGLRRPPGAGLAS